MILIRKKWCGRVATFSFPGPTMIALNLSPSHRLEWHQPTKDAFSLGDFHPLSQTSQQHDCTSLGPDRVRE